jgi:hypothetical protein
MRTALLRPQAPDVHGPRHGHFVRAPPLPFGVRRDEERKQIFVSATT